MDQGVVVRTDQVPLGVLVTTVDRDAAVAACGAGARRSGGKLPPHVVAYVTMAMCLFPEDDYEEVVTKVTGTLDDWGCWDARGVASRDAIRCRDEPDRQRSRRSAGAPR